ncbi:DnaJ-like protein subfamily C member 1 DnaJ protein-like protein MTJ1 Precursor [Larimichthys crocea]|uniref:DnaJ homolog subfamily C member 1 n=2 Tax=Larimichthys crocea TaxID=215358 RepID=A0A6G0IG10_LARCR|nr:DnaJ-like protein subfamily C member 1 DnaJ protein-like protein MTJ1 Precursor [Larimichthys crocea]TMS09513.1 DnaJ-like protein subfamily C member 1 [Larimichthys crocea]
MGVCAGPCRSVLVCLTLLVSSAPPLTAWDADLELLDLVEEIPQTFYQFLSVDQDASAAEIKKAYRRLSLFLHPDKNKDENAETQFRQLVSIYEVLKDDERRRKYDDILVNGLPDWRQPVFYYRRVRKMSNSELAFLLFLILTVGHYAVIWSIYLEKQLDELLSKKKKEKKKKLSSRPADDLRCISQDRPDRVLDRPHWQDILPLKLSIWLYLSIKNLPQTVQEVKQYYEDYQQMKQQQREEAEAEQEVVPREKRPKVKKPKVEFPVYEPTSENFQNYDQTTSIEEIEDQMDDWLQDRRVLKKKVADWTDEELSLLSRLMVKFPGGSPGRWDKIAQELGRSVTDVTTKVKHMKDNVIHTSGLVKLSELKGPPLPVRSLPVPDSVMTQRGGGACEEEEEESAATVRRRNRKSAAAEGGELKARGRRQKDFDPMAVEEEEVEPQENKDKADPAIWTQNQQKLLELALQQFPRGTTERWDCIAKVVPGKSKEECMIRYKMLAELVQRRKQAKN